MLDWLGLRCDPQRHILGIPPQAQTRSFSGQETAALQVHHQKAARISSWLSSVAFGGDPHSQDQAQGPAFRRLLLPWTQASSFRAEVPPVSITIHLDASTSGWGGHSEHKKVRGSWSPLFRTFHINVLELMTVRLCLLKICPPRGVNIHLVLDNQTAVLCIRRGGSRSPHLNAVALALERLCQRHDWHYTAVHLSGIRNVLVEALSRDSPQETEWSLDCRSFLEIQTLLLGLQIDLFASHENHQLRCL